MTLMFVVMLVSLGLANAWDYWDGMAAQMLDNALAKGRSDPEAFAVFDADNTIWENDLEESLLPFLEMKGVITRDTIDPSLKLIPFKDNESVLAYYYRLCEIADKICFPWIVQVFSGPSLNTLKTYVDELFAYNQPIPTKYWQGNQLVDSTVNPPKIYEAQLELITKLQANGIRVFVISAAAEELVRMVASDQKYGLNVPPERVIGVSLLLKSPTNPSDLTTARNQVNLGHFYDQTYTQPQHMTRLLTTYLWSPATFYVGKVAAIMDYIDPIKRPLLVGGDSPNDHFLLLYSGGYRIWVNRKADYMQKTRQVVSERFQRERTLGMTPTAGSNWIVVTPADLRTRAQNNNRLEIHVSQT